MRNAGGTGTGVLIGLGLAGLIGLAILSGGFGSRCPPGALSADIADVMDAGRYSWATLLGDVKALTFDSRGETGHTLMKGGNAGPQASIQRTEKSAKRKESCFDDKPVVIAYIQAEADFDVYQGAGTAEKKNYFVVWHDTKADKWHGAILNEMSRTEFANFTYLPHWRKGHPSDPDAETVPASELAPHIDACWNATNPTRRACFGEPLSTGGTGMGFGVALSKLLRAGDTEPWVSCAQYGCCCGGNGCHDEM